MLQLASHQEATTERRNLVPQLRKLADQMASAIRTGHVAEARKIARQHMLPPIAWGFLASCLQKNQIPADIIEGVLS